MALKLLDNKVVDLLPVLQNPTVSWVDVGVQVDVRDVNKIGIWIDLDINDALNVRFRALALHTEGGDEYLQSIKTVSASAVTIEDHFIEIGNDADAKIFFELDVNDTINYIQFQVSAGTAGSTPADIESFKISKQTRRRHS